MLSLEAVLKKYEDILGNDFFVVKHDNAYFLENDFYNITMELYFY